jgi:hypothetical protein
LAIGDGKDKKAVKSKKLEVRSKGKNQRRRDKSEKQKGCFSLKINNSKLFYSRLPRFRAFSVNFFDISVLDLLPGLITVPRIL